MTKKTETIQVKASAPITDPRPASERIAFDAAITEAKKIAADTANSLGIKLLELKNEDHSINVNDQGLPIASVDLEYSVSAFNQLVFDFKILSSSIDIFHLIKKEMRTKIFRFRFKKKNKALVKGSNVIKPKKALITGHFSIPGGGGTFGDVESMEVVAEWLSELGIEYVTASNQEDNVVGPNLLDIDPSEFNVFIFVCGPWYPERSIPALLLQRFQHCVKIGINLTTFTEDNAGFDILLPRDNFREHHADLAINKKQDVLPVVGVLLIERQTAYGSQQRHLYVKKVINEYIRANNVAPLVLDTVIHGNHVGLRSAQEFESLLRKVDVLITNRLHGLVLSVKNKVPVVAIDSIAGGGKLTAQARSLNWPIVIPVEELNANTLDQHVQACLRPNIRAIFDGTEIPVKTSVNSTKQRFFNIFNG